MEHLEPSDAAGFRSTRIVVGLGNPGAKYLLTRHNVGFMVLDLLIEMHRVELDRRLRHSDLAVFKDGGGEVWLVKPRCFMNRSGRAVKEVLAECGDENARILVVYDDFNLPVGKLRFRARGSAGGQNGVRSIIESLGSDEFGRMRIGIGTPHPSEDPADYVLANIPAGERGVLREAIEVGAEAASHWIRSGDIQDCMNRYN